MPASFLQALFVAAAFVGVVAWDQSHWWRLKEDYAFGWLVPFFVAFVIYERWPKIVALCRIPPETSAVSPRSRRGISTTLAFLVLCGGVIFFLFGALSRAGAGPTYSSSLALAAGASTVALSLVWLQAPVRESHQRMAVVACFLFPALVWLISAPLVSIVENALNVALLNKVTAVVFSTFELIGLPLRQQGNVLELPTGEVGLAEACSGIRSLTACLFAGSFLGAIFLDRLWKKIALVAVAMFFAFFSNLLRSLFLTGWAYRFGPRAIEGRVHDGAGWAILVITLIGLFCTLPLLNLKWASARPPTRARG